MFESKEEGSEENKKTKLHGKWKRGKGKSKQISAKKKITWSVDLVEVQKDEEGTSEQAYIKWALSRC